VGVEAMTVFLYGIIGLSVIIGSYLVYGAVEQVLYQRKNKDVPK
jgi:hypothetical protein